MIAGVRQPVLLFCSCALSCMTVAAESASDLVAKPATRSTLSGAQDPMSMSSLWQLTLGMLLVLSLIVGIAWVLKRSGRFQTTAGGGLRILGGLSMGARERVVLLQVGETQLLVGVAPGRVQTLHVLEQPLPSGASVAQHSPGFADQLGQFLKKEQAS